MKKKKEFNSNIDYKEKQESTQENIPIWDVIDGITITKDKKYIKLLEVKPQPFILKKNSQQDRISSEFETLLKVGPDEIHMKSISIPADLSYQIEKIKNCIDNEKNPSCKNMGYENLNRLYNAQNNGTTRRFFVSFPYTGGKSISFKTKDLSDYVYALNVDAQRMTSSLAACGNEVVQEYPDDENMSLLKIFHTIYNRDCYLDETFENRVKDVYEKYKNKLGEKDFYVPISDYIAPKRVSYWSSKYLKVNDLYYSFLYIPDYGYQVKTFAGWLSNFDIAGVDVDVFLKRVPSDTVIQGIRRSIASNRLGAAESNDVSDAYEDSINKLGSSTYLKEGISAGNDFYYMSTFITVCNRDVDKLAEVVEEIKKMAIAQRIVLKENKYRCEEMFKIVFPTSQWDDNLYSFEKTKRNILTEGAASMYMFTTDQLIEKDGFYIADDQVYGSPVIVDQFNRQRLNSPHLMCISQTGGGKTVFEMLLGMRARITASYNGPGAESKRISRVIYICPEKQDEYRRMVSAMGGIFLDISSSSNDRLNIMAIYKIDDEVLKKLSEIDGVDKDSISSRLQDKISTLIDFFSLHIERMSDVEKYDLEDAIIRTYAKKGITTDNESLWADAGHTRYKKMPIISDLVEELESNPETQTMAKTIKLLTRGSGAMFDGQTNVDVDNPFVVIGIEKNPESMMSLVSFLAMDFANQKLMEDRTQKKLYIFDEFWKVTKNPVSLAMVEKSARLMRAASCAIILATQSIRELCNSGDSAAVILESCQTKVFLHLEEDAAELVADIFKLTAKEKAAIIKFKAGEGLLIARDTRMKVKFTPSETEKLLTFTDDETLMRYRELKQRQKQEEEMEKRLADAVELDDLFESNEERREENA